MGFLCREKHHSAFILNKIQNAPFFFFFVSELTHKDSRRALMSEVNL